MARSSVKFKLDRKGIAEILRATRIATAVHDAAESVAAEVRGDPNLVRREIADQVKVDDYTTDRAASSVTVTHAAGLGMEAKHGVLSRAVGGAE